MKRRGWFAGGVIVAIVTSIPMAPSSFASGNVNFFVGQKMLDEDDWEPIEDQSEFGAQITVGSQDWPVHIAIDVFGSADEEELFGFDVEGSTSEIDFGARKVWGKEKTHPFVGAGIAFVAGEFEALGLDDDDSATGYWADAGLFWRLGPKFNLGFDVRLSRAEITLFGVDGEAGGEHVGILLGWGW